MQSVAVSRKQQEAFVRMLFVDGVFLYLYPGRLDRSAGG